MDCELWIKEAEPEPVEHEQAWTRPLVFELKDTCSRKLLSPDVAILRLRYYHHMRKARTLFLAVRHIIWSLQRMRRVFGCLYSINSIYIYTI